MHQRCRLDGRDFRRVDDGVGGPLDTHDRGGQVQRAPALQWLRLRVGEVLLLASRSTVECRHCGGNMTLTG